MKCIVLVLFALSVASSAAQEIDSYSLNPLKNTIAERSLGDYSGHSEKYLHSAGDRVSIGLVKIYDEKQLNDPKTVKLVLELVKESFRQPELISLEEDRSPNVTFLLLDSIKIRLKDKKAQDEIDEVKRFVTERLHDYRPRAGHPS